MLFDLGNIITLAVCVALILVFRQIDSNNKSIDKVKKFTDKLKIDLDAYIDGRNKSLQDAAVDLDVKQQHAIASVKRLEKFEEDFTTRSSQMEEKINGLTTVEKRIDDYDTIIKNLIEMTARAEDNLQTLSNHSKHFDKAFAKIKELEEKLSKVDAQIPALTEKFVEKNQEQLQNIGINLLDDFTNRTDVLGQQYEVYTQKCNELYKSIDTTIEQSFDNAAKKAELLEGSTFAKLKDESDKRSQEYLAAVEQKNVEIRRSTEDAISGFQQMAADFKNQLAQEMNTYEDSVRVEMENISSKLQDTIYQLDAKVNDFTKQTENRIEEFNTRMDNNDQRIELTFNETESKINTFKDDIKNNVHESAAKLEDMNREFAEKLQDMNREFAEKTVELEANFKDAESRIVSTADEKINQIQNMLSSQIAKIESEMQTTYGSLSDTLESKNTELLSEISTRFESYKSDVQYHLNTFEKVSGDISQMEEELRNQMEETKNGVVKDFDDFVHDQQSKQLSFEKSIQDGTIAINQELQGVQQELDNLKKRAYENVSDHLKLFEEDFFKDLKKRSDFVQTSVDKWTTEMEDKLNSLTEASESERRTFEYNYTEQLKAHLAELTEKFNEQSANYDSVMKNSEEDIHSKLADYEEKVNTFIEQCKTELENATASNKNYIDTNLESHKAEIKAQLDSQKREVASQVKDIVADVGIAREKADSSLETVKTDFATWSDRLNQQFNDTKEIFDERFSKLEANSAELITQVGTSFNQDVENYAAKVREEKERLVGELDSLKNQMTQSVTSYETRAEEVLNEFKKSYESMLEETGQKIREQNNDSNNKLRDLKAVVQEISSATDATQDKLHLRIRTEENEMNLKMDEIQKRLTGFIEQTKLFDRADEMKAELEEQMSELKTELSRIETFRQTTADIENQFTKIRRMDDEIVQKITKFEQEKKRIEILESDFNNLMTMSNTMDKKIAELKNANDELVSLQLEIRGYKDDLGKLNTLYDRLDKKNPILEQTMNGIDRSFANLQEIEKRIATCNLEVQKMPDQVADVKKDITRLLESNARVNDVIKKLDSLDDIIKDAETRIGEMNKAREWLARTETRLTEVSKEAQDQVRVMGEMLKQDNVGTVQKKVSQSGRLTVAQRNEIVKLAASGWTVSEIANNYKVSPGEIELILELNTRKS